MKTNYTSEYVYDTNVLFIQGRLTFSYKYQAMLLSAVFDIVLLKDNHIVEL